MVSVGVPVAADTLAYPPLAGASTTKVPLLVTLPESRASPLCPLGAVTVTVCPAGIVPERIGVSISVKEPTPLSSVSVPLLYSETGWPLCGPFWVQEALLLSASEPPLTTPPGAAASLSNSAVALVMSKLAPESTVKVPLLVVVVAASWSRVPVLTSTVAPAALVSGTSRASSLPPSCWVRSVPLLVRALPVSLA